MMHILMNALDKISLLDLKKAEGSQDSKIRIKTEKKFGLPEESLILCRNCGNTITFPEHIISVNGQHQHTFTNPAGITYEIGCFSSAEGCIMYGEPTAEHSWFKDFTWSFTICSNCLVHLGWFYLSGSESFFGLIVDRLVDATTKL